MPNQFIEDLEKLPNIYRGNLYETKANKGIKYKVRHTLVCAYFTYTFTHIKSLEILF